VPSCLLLLLGATTFADQPRELIKQGNELFQAGQYAEALEAYQQIEEPDELITPELLHNQAAAHFKLGQLDDARELWVRAASLKDARFEAAARYNLGNCNYAAALQALDGQDAQGALEHLQRGLQEYRDALQLDPELLDARANLELTAQLKKQIEEMAQQQPQSQPSSQPSDQNQEQPEQDQQPSSQPSSQPSDSDHQDQDQQPEDSEDQQQDQPQPSSQPDSQPDPESQPAPQPQASEGEQEQEQQPPVPIQLTKEEAERLLQMIRDAERQRRAILRDREAAKQQPVTKDW
jgi:Ca-activated chloride channel family protein